MLKLMEHSKSRFIESRSPPDGNGTRSIYRAILEPLSAPVRFESRIYRGGVTTFGRRCFQLRIYRAVIRKTNLPRSESGYLFLRFTINNAS